MEQVMPKCKGCGTQPMPFIVHEATSPKGLVLGFFCCAACGEIYNIIPIGMQEPKVITLGRN